MATRMQQRRGTAAQWISTNSGNGPILEVGEIGFETDTGKFKIGDGTSPWASLSYFADVATLGTALDGDFLLDLMEVKIFWFLEPQLLLKVQLTILLKQH